MTGEYRFGDTPDTQVIVFIRNPCINSAEPSIAVTTQLYVKLNKPLYRTCETIDHTDADARCK